MRTSPGRLAAAAVLLAIAIGLNRQLERQTNVELPSHSLYLPSGRYLKHATLGFQTVAADLLYVWSIQYYSDGRADRWRHLASFYDVITDLDPRFVSAYSIGALMLAMEARDVRHALDLLDKGIRANPDTYFLGWEAAFYARDLGDRPRQLDYLRIAMGKPDAPSFVRNWYNYSLAESGRKEEALRLWRETYAGARNDLERNAALRHIRELTIELDLAALRGLIAEFRTRAGRSPASLEEVRDAGLLREMPRDPDGEPYGYDPARGEVFAVEGSLRERLR